MGDALGERPEEDELIASGTSVILQRQRFHAVQPSGLTSGPSVACSARAGATSSFLSDAREEPSRISCRDHGAGSTIFNSPSTSRLATTACTADLNCGCDRIFACPGCYRGRTALWQDRVELRQDQKALSERACDSSGAPLCHFWQSLP